MAKNTNPFAMGGAMSPPMKSAAKPKAKPESKADAAEDQVDYANLKKALTVNQVPAAKATAIIKTYKSLDD